MSNVRNDRRRMKCALAFTAAVAKLAWNAEGTLTINQWTGDAGTTQWSNTGNWLGGYIPDSTDQATVYSGTIGLNAAPPSVGGLLLGDVGSSATVYTEGFKLNVLGTADLDGGTIVAQAAPASSFSLQTPTLTLTQSAELTMIASNAYVRVSSTTTGTANGTLSVDATSYIYTDGTLDTGTYTNNGGLYADATSTVNATTFTLAGTSSNPATIYPKFGNSLTINATTFELNNPYATINVGDADCTLNMIGNIDYSSGYVGADITVGDTATLSFNPTAYIGYYSKSGNGFVSHGNVTMDGGPTLARAATINGGAFLSNVSVNGYGNLPGAEFDGGANVTVAASSYLYLNSSYFRGGSTSNGIYFNGPGTVFMSGNTQIGYSGSGIPYTTVNIQAGTVFGWAGTSEYSASCSITNGELDIYSSTIDAFHGQLPYNPTAYTGALSITGGALLDVAGTAWTLDGTMALSPGAIVQGQTLTMDGSHLSPGTYSLTPSYSGTTFPVIQAPVVFNPNTYIYMGFNGGLHLDGSTTWAGGQVISAPFVVGNPPYGVLVQDGNATVTANTDIFCDVLDMDGTSNTATWTINPGVLFTQQAFYLDSAGSTTNPFHSTLTLNGGSIDMQTSSGVWTLAGGTISMNQSGSNYPNIVDDKLILGSGATIGTIQVGAASSAYINAVLQSGATSVAGGNIINVASGSGLYINQFGSDANAVLTKTGAGSFTVYGFQNHGVGSMLTVSQGVLNLNSDAGGGGANLALNASGGVTNFAVSQHLLSLTIGAGALAAVAPVVFPNQRLFVETTLNMSGGTLDIGDDDIICHNGVLATLWQNVQAGYAGGHWNGASGIESSTAAADTSHLHAVGIILNKSAISTPLYTSLDGQSCVTTDVLIRYTYYGDATLDGKVDGSDYSRIDNGHLNNLTGWYNGDFNYDGLINGSDYTLIDNAFNTQGAQLAAQVGGQVATATAEVDAGVSQTAVPEPASIVTIGIVAIGMLGRRRRW